jgi:hypothetical protein
MENDVPFKDNSYNYFIYENGKLTPIDSKNEIFQIYHVQITKAKVKATNLSEPNKIVEIFIEIFDDVIKTEPRVFFWKENKIGNKVKEYID